jgi:predicted DCC family thiol-disulfide oxidoreductase YuxK
MRSTMRPDLARVGLLLGEHQIAHRVIVAGPVQARPHVGVVLARRPLLAGQHLLADADLALALVALGGGTLLAGVQLAAGPQRADIQGAQVENAAGDKLAVVGARRDPAHERPISLQDGVRLRPVGIEPGIGAELREWIGLDRNRRPVVVGACGGQAARCHDEAAEIGEHLAAIAGKLGERAVHVPREILPDRDAEQVAGLRERLVGASRKLFGQLGGVGRRIGGWRRAREAAVADALHRLDRA